MMFNHFQNFNFQALDLITYLQDNLNKNLFNDANYRLNDLKSTNLKNFNQNILISKNISNPSNANILNNPQMASNLVNKQSELIQNLPIKYVSYVNDDNSNEANSIFKNNPSNNFPRIHPINVQERRKFSDNEKNYLNRNKALKEKFFDLKCKDLCIILF